MEGTYGGYDGPFPPLNDERLHHYHFIVYALDVPSLELEGDFKLDDVRAAIEGHVLDEGELVGDLHALRRQALDAASHARRSAREVEVGVERLGEARDQLDRRLEVAEVDHLDRRVHVAQRDR